MDFCHLLLLLPFLLFDLLFDEVSDFKRQHGTTHTTSANDLITLVLALLEWYRFYRSAHALHDGLTLFKFN